MRLDKKRYQIAIALEMQKRTGSPSLTLRNSPTLTKSISEGPLNKNRRPRKRPMEEAEKLEIVKRTGSTPYLEVVFK